MLATAVAAKEHAVALPAAICSVSPVVDLHFQFPSYTERAERDCVLFVSQDEIVKQLYVRGADTSDPFMSPYFANFTGFRRFISWFALRKCSLNKASRRGMAFRKSNASPEGKHFRVSNNPGFALSKAGVWYAKW